jgi:hypothetical protein
MRSGKGARGGCSNQGTSYYEICFQLAWDLKKEKSGEVKESRCGLASVYVPANDREKTHRRSQWQRHSDVSGEFVEGDDKLAKGIVKVSGGSIRFSTPSPLHLPFPLGSFPSPFPLTLPLSHTTSFDVIQA